MKITVKMFMWLSLISGPGSSLQLPVNVDMENSDDDSTNWLSGSQVGDINLVLALVWSSFNHYRHLGSALVKGNCLSKQKILRRNALRSKCEKGIRKKNLICVVRESVVQSHVRKYFFVRPYALACTVFKD